MSIYNKGAYFRYTNTEINATTNPLIAPVWNTPTLIPISDVPVRGTAAGLASTPRVILPPLPRLPLALTEQIIYGSARIGAYKPQRNQKLPVTDPNIGKIMPILVGQLTLGYKSYELSNHLGNVLTTISDNKMMVQIPASGTVSAQVYLQAIVLTTQDYYPFGMAMTERGFSNVDRNSQRYGFNTQEKDLDIDQGGSHYTAEFWEYDGRTGRRWNVDPVVKLGESNYNVLSNSPICRVDPFGDDDYFDGYGRYVGSDNQKTQLIRIIDVKNVEWANKENKILKANIKADLFVDYANKKLKMDPELAKKIVMRVAVYFYWGRFQRTAKTVGVEENEGSLAHASGKDRMAIAYGKDGFGEELNNSVYMESIFEHEDTHRKKDFEPVRNLTTNHPEIGDHGKKGDIIPFYHLDASIAQVQHSGFKNISSSYKQKLHLHTVGLMVTYLNDTKNLKMDANMALYTDQDLWDKAIELNKLLKDNGCSWEIKMTPDVQKNKGTDTTFTVVKTKQK